MPMMAAMSVRGLGVAQLRNLKAQAKRQGVSLKEGLDNPGHGPEHHMRLMSPS
jgi:hypothetical protein